MNIVSFPGLSTFQYLIAFIDPLQYPKTEGEGPGPFYHVNDVGIHRGGGRDP